MYPCGVLFTRTKQELTPLHLFFLASPIYTHSSSPVYQLALWTNKCNGPAFSLVPSLSVSFWNSSLKAILKDLLTVFSWHYCSDWIAFLVLHHLLCCLHSLSLIIASAWGRLLEEIISFPQFLYYGSAGNILEKWTYDFSSHLKEDE